MMIAMCVYLSTKGNLKPSIHEIYIPQVTNIAETAERNTDCSDYSEHRRDTARMFPKRTIDRMQACCKNKFHKLPSIKLYYATVVGALCLSMMLWTSLVTGTQSEVICLAKHTPHRSKPQAPAKALQPKRQGLRSCPPQSFLGCSATNTVYSESVVVS